MDSSLLSVDAERPILGADEPPRANEIHELLVVLWKQQKTIPHPHPEMNVCHCMIYGEQVQGLSKKNCSESTPWPNDPTYFRRRSDGDFL